MTTAWKKLHFILSIIWKSDLTDKMKHSFFQAAVISILLYGCTTWTLTKWLEKKLDGNYDANPPDTTKTALPSADMEGCRIVDKV